MEIEGFSGSDSVNSINAFNKATGGLTTYDGSSGTAFPLLPGEGYFILMNLDVPGWTPSHY